MGATNDHHRPLLSGILVKSARKVGDQLQYISTGTLTGLATRNSDSKKKVLVTNLHVMADISDSGVYQEPSGDEEMYQEAVSNDKKVGSLPAWDPDSPAWVPVVAGQNNVADVAICELDQGVDAKFILHDHPNHSDRQIIEGVVEPVDDDENPMRLTMLGAVNGEGTVTVDEVNDMECINGRTFTGLVVLDASQRPILDGDSGAPCLVKVRDNRYKMSCIVISSNASGHDGRAFPASVAQRELGITFGNRAPIAKASAPRIVAPGGAVTLDGSGSSDPEGDTLTYHWEQVTGSGMVPIGSIDVTLSSTSVASPTFTAPSKATRLTFRLTVTDSLGQTGTDTVTVRVNRQPVAVATAPETVAPDDPVILDGSGSSDPDGDTLTYHWEQVTGSGMVPIGSIDVTLSSTSVARPTFTAPSKATRLTFRLTVTDSLGQTGTDTVTVRVNRQPVAVATAPETVAPDDPVILDGSGSSDPDGDTLTYHWEQVTGSGMVPIGSIDVTLSSTSVARPTFTAPSKATRLTFRLTVTDSLGQTAMDTVTVRVNRPPVAVATAPETVAPDDPVILDGSGSSDPDGDTLTYHWVQMFGSVQEANRPGARVKLSDAAAANPSFTAPQTAGTLRFRLTVTDNHGASGTDDVTITVTPVYATPANFRAAATSNPGELHCTWTGPAGFDSATDQYQLRYKTETASIWSSLSMTAASYTLTNLASDGALYNVEVRAHYRDANGNTEGYSDFVSATGITSTPTNRAPIADAIGPIGTVTEGDTVSLDGTGSSDPDGDTLIYSWTQTAGPAVTLSNTASARPTFTAPAGPATLSFRLTVSDSQERTDSDTVSVSVESSTPPHTDHEDHDDHGDHTDHSDHTDRDALEAREHSDHDDHQDVTASHSDHSDRDALEAREHSDHDDHQDVTASHSDHTDRDSLSARSHSDHGDTTTYRLGLTATTWTTVT